LNCEKNLFWLFYSRRRDHAHLYQYIVANIKSSGAQVLSELFADKSVLSHLRSTPHLAVNDTWHKPTLALFYAGSGRRLSPMISGNPDIDVFEYSDASQTKEAIAALFLACSPAVLAVHFTLLNFF